MARKITDTYPQITLTIGGEVQKFSPYKMSREEAWAARDEIVHLIKTVLMRTTRRQIDIDTKIVEEAVCEYCNWAWTEGPKSPWNGGCCDRDEANGPERLTDSTQGERK